MGQESYKYKGKRKIFCPSNQEAGMAGTGIDLCAGFKQSVSREVKKVL